MRGEILRAAWVALLLSLPARGAPQGFERRVDEAIDRGVGWLLERIEKDGWLARHPLGTTAIEVCALAKSGVGLDHPKMREGLERLTSRLPVAHAYSVSLCLMALDAILHEMEIEQALVSGRGFLEVRPPKAIGERLKACASWLVDKRVQGKGSWNYDGEQNRYDNSNTQFAVLGLGVAAKRGIPIAPGIWAEIARHFIEDQQPKGPPGRASVGFRRPEGPRRGATDVRGADPRRFRPAGEARIRGWSYQEPKGAARATMTCAGLSSLLIARDYLLRSPGGCPPALLEGIDRAIRDGYAWVSDRKGKMDFGSWHYYGLYSLEKVGDLGEVETFDGWDWYRWAAEDLIKRQKADGHWEDPRRGGGMKGREDFYEERYNTAFALLVLNRATDLLSFTRPLFLSGRSGAREVGGDLVYIPRLDAQVSLRLVVRKLRFSPSPGVLRLAEDLLEAYPIERKGDLVEPLLGLFASPYRPVQAFARRALADLTGIASSSPEPYEAWHARWRELEGIIRGRDASAAPKLREYLRSLESPRLKMRVVEGLRALRVKEAIGELIGELSAEDAEYRSRVYDALTYLADAYLPFDAKGPKAVRDRQIEAWRAWWEGRGGSR